VLTRDRLTAVVVPTRLLFEGNGSSLRSGSSSPLRAVAQRVRYNSSGRRLVVEAHSDGRGTASYALKLSRRRALTVVGWLSGNGFEGAVITARGYGDTAPAGPRAARRDSRVVVSVLERRKR
jgi:outer membrane protein OmpA-like peptidoglycan-associated protein